MLWRQCACVKSFNPRRASQAILTAVILEQDDQFSGFNPRRASQAILTVTFSTSSWKISLQLHLEREELSLESSWEMSREPEPLRALLASMCHARSCNPSDWYPSSKARTA